MSDPLGLISGSAASAAQSIRPQAPAAPGASAGPSFKDVLMKNIEQVNQIQQEADRQIADLASGKTNDYAHVMMAQEKADLAFQLLVKVQNKMTEAYSEIKQINV
jgi:flagellar hook-basal body complex protein FliE